MSIAVDARVNALVVLAPDPLFQEVKSLVSQIDQASGRSDETVQVVALRRPDAGLLRDTLPALTGQKVQFGQTASLAIRSQIPSLQNQTTSPQAGQSSIMGPRVGGFPGGPQMSGAPQNTFGGTGMNAGSRGADRGGAAPNSGAGSGADVGPDGGLAAGPGGSEMAPPGMDGGPGMGSGGPGMGFGGPGSRQLPGQMFGAGPAGGGRRSPMGSGQSGQQPSISRGSSGSPAASSGPTSAGGGVRPR